MLQDDDLDFALALSLSDQNSPRNSNVGLSEETTAHAPDNESWDANLPPLKDNPELVCQTLLEMEQVRQ